MKKIILAVVVYLISFQSIIAQKNKIVGKATYKKSLDMEVDENSDAKGFIESMIKATNDAIFVLEFNKNESTFELSTSDSKNDMGPRANMSTMMGGGNGIYYLNTKKMFISIKKRDMEKNF